MGLHCRVHDFGELTPTENADALGTEFRSQASEKFFTREKEVILLGQLGRRPRQGHGRGHRVCARHWQGSEWRNRVGRVRKRLRSPRKHGDARVQRVLSWGTVEKGYQSEGRA